MINKWWFINSSTRMLKCLLAGTELKEHKDYNLNNHFPYYI
jgi:hypothetical protein